MTSHGIVTRAQLLADGVPSSTISRRYHRILPQIYSPDAPTWIGRCHAVTRWQTGAVLSHRAAAHVYGWIKEPEQVEATISLRARVNPPAWLTFYHRELPCTVVDRFAGLPVVSREQALIDCVAVMDEHDAARLVDECLASGLDSPSVRKLIESSPNRRGNERTLWHLNHASIGFASEPERVFDRALIERGVRLKINCRVGKYIVDFLDELSRVIVEIDGREHHIDPEAFRKDRRRNNELTEDGWHVLRFAAYDVLADFDRIAEYVIEIIRRRRHSRR